MHGAYLCLLSGAIADNIHTKLTWRENNLIRYIFELKIIQHSCISFPRVLLLDSLRLWIGSIEWDKVELNTCCFLLSWAAPVVSYDVSINKQEAPGMFHTFKAVIGWQKLARNSTTSHLLWINWQSSSIDLQNFSISPFRPGYFQVASTHQQLSLFLPSPPRILLPLSALRMVAIYRLHCCSRVLPSLLLGANIFLIWSVQTIF